MPKRTKRAKSWPIGKQITTKPQTIKWPSANSHPSIRRSEMFRRYWPKWLAAGDTPATAVSNTRDGSINIRAGPKARNPADHRLPQSKCPCCSTYHLVTPSGPLSSSSVARRPQSIDRSISERRTRPLPLNPLASIHPFSISDRSIGLHFSDR